MSEQYILNDIVLSSFSAFLKEQFGEDLEHIWLFGSRARGDAREGSDYDFLVTVRGDKIKVKKLVREAAWLCMAKHNALVASIVYSPEQWEQRKNSPLGHNISREGKLIA